MLNHTLPPVSQMVQPAVVAIPADSALLTSFSINFSVVNGAVVAPVSFVVTPFNSAQMLAGGTPFSGQIADLIGQAALYPALSNLLSALLAAIPLAINLQQATSAVAAAQSHVTHLSEATARQTRHQAQQSSLQAQIAAINKSQALSPADQAIHLAALNPQLAAVQGLLVEEAAAIAAIPADAASTLTAAQASLAAATQAATAPV
jgi:hypothetical protein